MKGERNTPPPWHSPAIIHSYCAILVCCVPDNLPAIEEEDVGDVLLDDSEQHPLDHPVKRA